jgi:GntR family transcriptional regulator / MocR family aminotransferase
MAKRARGHPIPLLSVPGERAGQPRYVRLYRRIREGVLQGALAPGTRLPSARTLAREEGLSRNTVDAALAQLQAEGFVVRRVGSGSWISDRIRNEPLRPSRFSDAEPSHPTPLGFPDVNRPARLSARGRSMAAFEPDGLTQPGLLFTPCTPGVDALPLDAWNRIASRAARRASGSLLMPPPPEGLPALREAVAGHVAMSRGVRCTAERVVIVNSTQQAIDLVARLLLDPGDSVWFEEPGYVSARHALAAAGARLVPVPVDQEGLNVAAGSALSPDARLAYVTPSHQYPLGVTLSLERRIALLEWATQGDRWILEDDYDSELRYEGRPHASVQGIDATGRVIYAGTFNKILFPTLRVAYLVLPQELVEPFARARLLTDGYVPTLTQRVLAEFIEEGHFASHVRRIRGVFRERRDGLLAATAKHLPGDVSVGPAAAGMHVAIRFPPGIPDGPVSAAARRRGIALPRLSEQYIGAPADGVLVHYGNAPVRDIEMGIQTLSDLLASSRGAGGRLETTLD